MGNYKSFYWAVLAAASFGLVATFISHGEVKLAFFALAAVGLMTATGLSILISLRCGRPERYWLLVVGLLVIGGGAGFDVYATLVHSPDLSREANPVATTMLASGFGSDSIIMVGIVAQAMLIVVCSLVWMNFVERLEWYKQRLVEKDDAPIIIRMLGVSGRDWWAALTGKIDPPLFVSGIAPAVLAVFVYRIYLALEWFEVVPISRLLVPALIFIITIIFQWLW